MNKQSSHSETALAQGTWGGDHISLEVTEGGAAIEYDCAHGTIDKQIMLDDQGKFSARGSYVREGPGPIRVGREAAELPATYSGTNDGKTLTLKVKLDASDEEIGTFRLTYGMTGRIRKCK